MSRCPPGIRGAVVLLGLAVGAGCATWTPRDGAPAGWLARERPARIRVIRTDGRALVLERPTLQRDTLVGSVERDGLQAATSRLAVPLAEVRDVAVPGVSRLRTAALVALLTLLAGAALFVVAFGEALRQWYED